MSNNRKAQDMNGAEFDWSAHSAIDHGRGLETKTKQLESIIN